MNATTTASEASPPSAASRHERVSRLHLGGEDGARLPLVPSYVDFLRSPVADLVNGTFHVPDSAVLSATYLRQFAGSTPWAHLDVGSTAWLTSDWGGFPKGPTGVPLRTLLRLLEQRASVS